MDRVPLT